jgi:hypothetical protein
MVAVAYVNGRICSQQDALISVFDHGFLFGEGVYEVVRTYNGEPFLFDRHLARLKVPRVHYRHALLQTPRRVADGSTGTLERMA